MFVCSVNIATLRNYCIIVLNLILGTLCAVYGYECIMKGVSMAKTNVCPFYGKNDDYCDVGCAYISPHDVNMIIRYCSARYPECEKYMELVDRFPSELINLVKC